MFTSTRSLHIDVLVEYARPTMRKRSAAGNGDMLQGTLDLLILQSLVLGPAHGHTIAHAIERGSDHMLQVEHGSLYPALHRLEDRGLVASFWGTSENNRKAKYYRLTAAGRKRWSPRPPLGAARQGDRPHPQARDRVGMGWTRFFRRSRRDDDFAREIALVHSDRNRREHRARHDAGGGARGGNPEVRQPRARARGRVSHEHYRSARHAVAGPALRHAGAEAGQDFALAAIASLALGIGANTAIFQLLDAIRLRTLPVDRPHELLEVRIPPGGGGRNGSFNGRRPNLTYAIWEQLQQRQQVLSGAFAWSSVRFNTPPGGEVRYVEGLCVSGDYFHCWAWVRSSAACFLHRRTAAAARIPAQSSATPTGRADSAGGPACSVRRYMSTAGYFRSSA